MHICQCNLVLEKQILIICSNKRECEQFYKANEHNMKSVKRKQHTSTHTNTQSLIPSTSSSNKLYRLKRKTVTFLIKEIN